MLTLEITPLRFSAVALCTVGCISAFRWFSSKKVIHTDKAPKAIGPYSQAIEANGFIFVSGALGLNPETGNFPSEEVEDQTKQAMDNIGCILKEAGSSYDKIVKVTILLKSIEDFPKVNEIYAKYFKGNFPARATYAVAALPKNGKIEIECTATK